MTDRSEGPHISSGIHALCVQLGHYEPRDYVNQLQLELGNAFEWAMIDRYQRHYPDEYIQPGELEKDGIFGTPDLLHLPTIRVHEFKLTWMSSRHEPDDPKLWKYLAQLKAYCWMLETESAVLHVGYVNGDYRSGGPDYREWEFQFTLPELAENWALLKTRLEILSDQS